MTGLLRDRLGMSQLSIHLFAIQLVRIMYIMLNRRLSTNSRLGLLVNLGDGMRPGNCDLNGRSYRVRLPIKALN